MIRIPTAAAAAWRRFTVDQSGATAVEYCLIATGIAGAIIAAVTGLGEKVLGMWNYISGEVEKS
jgi:pilus assembly protein Flp/PilA